MTKKGSSVGQRRTNVEMILAEETKANKPTTSSFDNLDRSSFDPSSSVYHIFNNDESNSYICVSIFMTKAIFLPIFNVFTCLFRENPILRKGEIL